MLDRGELSGALDAMVGSVLFGGGDWREPQDLYLGLLTHPDHQISALAATCLGHVARVHGHLDHDRVATALHECQSIPHLIGPAANALDDIEIFLRPRRAR